jgi:hypothetical protein
MTTEFLKMSLEERREYIPKISQIAQNYGIKILFWGMPMGVSEHLVIVFETNDSEKYLIFQREWLELGTDKAGKRIKNTRTIAVY